MSNHGIGHTIVATAAQNDRYYQRLSNDTVIMFSAESYGSSTDLEVEVLTLNEVEGFVAVELGIITKEENDAIIKRRVAIRVSASKQHMANRYVDTAKKAAEDPELAKMIREMR
jgi:hypothetical protein